uniref:Uncharacterized protein n=1 Tax=Cannabis sativa TaxID=3483 RepID=A0A803PJH3_CANSA
MSVLAKNVNRLRPARGLGGNQVQDLHARIERTRSTLVPQPTILHSKFIPGSYPEIPGQFRDKCADRQGALTMARGYVALEVEEKRHNEEVSRETLSSGDTFLFESKNRTPAVPPHNRTDNRSANERNTRGTVMETKWPPRMANDPKKRIRGDISLSREHGHTTSEKWRLKIEVNRR